MIDLHHGDCLDVLRTLPSNSVEACVTDPPYGLSFMGKKWDYDVPSVDVWREVLRVLKPGAHLLAFFGTRTYHRGVTAIEDAGFEIRDQLAWVYGSGFPKSLDVSKAIDATNGRKFADRYALGRHIRDRREAAGVSRAEVNRWLGAATKCEHYESDSNGFARVPTTADYRVLRDRLGLSDEWSSLVERVEAEREVVGKGKSGDTAIWSEHGGMGEFDITVPATDAARQWDGWGTALKPAQEPIVLARKPLIGTVAENVQRFGTGALNIDGCRVAGGASAGGASSGMSALGQGSGWNAHANRATPIDRTMAAGRWPANLLHDGSEEVVALFPQTTTNAGTARTEHKQGWYGKGTSTPTGTVLSTGDSGSAARFFYCAKASKRDRDEGLEGFAEQPTGTMQDDAYRWQVDGKGNRISLNTTRRNTHPTVKPTALMRWLVRLVTPASGTVLDPFMGSGSTGKACALEGVSFIGIDREAEYVEIARARIAAAEPDTDDVSDDSPRLPLEA